MDKIRRLKGRVIDQAIFTLQHVGPRLTGSRKSRESAAYYAEAAWRDITQHKFQSAIFLATAAILDDPTWHEGHRMLGLAYQQMGDTQLARQAYRAGLANLPDAPSLLGAIGDLEWEAGNFQEAETAYRRALEYQTDQAARPKLLLNVALAVDKQGRHEEAIASLQSLLENAPTYARPALALGQILLDLGRPAEAVSAFRTGVRRDPGPARPHYDLAFALARQEHWQEALAEARQSAALDPTNTDYAMLVSAVERRLAEL